MISGVASVSKPGLVMGMAHDGDEVPRLITATKAANQRLLCNTVCFTVCFFIFLSVVESESFTRGLPLLFMRRIICGERARKAATHRRPPTPPRLVRGARQRTFAPRRCKR